MAESPVRSMERSRDRRSSRAMVRFPVRMVPHKTGRIGPPGCPGATERAGPGRAVRSRVDRDLQRHPAPEVSRLAL